MNRLTLVVAALALALPAATAGRTAARAPVLGRDWTTRTIARFDPVTLKRVSRRGAPAGFFTGPWAYDAGRTRLAVTRYDWPEVRILDAARLKVLGDVRLTSRGTFGGVAAVRWVGRDRLLAVVRLEPGLAAVVVDTARRAVVRTSTLAGVVSDVERSADGLVALLAPEQGIGAARLGIVDADGAVRTARLPAVAIGTRKVGAGADPLVRSVQPGLATVPEGGLAVVVTPANRAVAVDTRTLAVTTHELEPTRAPSSAAKAIDGPQRYAKYVGDGLIAVSGSNYRMSSGSLATTAAGVELVDTRTWSARMVDAGASAFATTGEGLVAFGGSSTQATHAYVGARGYALDGERRWTLYDGEDVYAEVKGELVYVHRHVGTNRPEHVDVVDPTTGTVVHSLTWPRGQAMPTLYAGDASA
jgi:hypothetical protein